jgi:staphylococcal nuclease domain-containing protein 1
MTFPNQGTAIVKAVISGDTVVLRGKPVNGPPPEMMVTISNIIAPRLLKENEEVSRNLT